MNLRFPLALAAFAAVAPFASATVLDFEDLSFLQPLTGTYHGITWGTSSFESMSGSTGEFLGYSSPTYANANSGGGYLINGYGANRLYFSFSVPTTFNGAYFSKVQAIIPWNVATKMRFRDNLGNVSSWLTLADTPQYLQADFVGSSTIYVEHDGGGPHQYAMDDLSFVEAVPEPASLLALGTGALALLRRRRPN